MSLEDYLRDVEKELPREGTGKLVCSSAVTQIALFLASEDCKSVNGSSVVIDGGMIA